LKEFWVRITEDLPIEKKRDVLRKSAGICDVIFVSDNDVSLAREMGARKVASPSEGDIHISKVVNPDDIGTFRLQEGNTGVEITVQSGSDEEIALTAAQAGAKYILVSCPNWKVIPLENLISKIHGKNRLIAEVSDLEEARTALETLEIGVDGILLKAEDSESIDRIAEITRISENMLTLTEVKITGIKPLGTGARVCVDTTELMKHGEGMLVGCQSSGLFLAQAEVEVNPHVETRPFRVNAGPVSCYVLAPGNKTKYLSDLKAGDEVLIVDRTGKTRIGNVGRIKIESRPMLLIEAEGQGIKIKTVTQNAETIHLVTPKGAVSVSQLKIGDTVIARLEEGGRHFGTLVKDEMVIER
jgi:3-dehydroquinate synthase II